MNDLHNCYTIKATDSSNKQSFHSLSSKEQLLWKFSGQVLCICKCCVRHELPPEFLCHRMWKSPVAVCSHHICIRINIVFIWCHHLRASWQNLTSSLRNLPWKDLFKPSNLVFCAFFLPLSPNGPHRATPFIQKQLGK